MSASQVPELFFAFTDLVIIGQNPEMADMSNPAGYIYGYSAYVAATDSDGNTKIKHIKTARWQQEVLPEAEELAEAMNAAHNETGRLPADFDHWQDGRAVYGSYAWQQYGEREQIEYERNEERDY